MAYIYLNSGADGKKVIGSALRVPEIIALYEKSTVLISPLMKPEQRGEFLKMKQ
jgi:hypothetical protein